MTSTATLARTAEQLAPQVEPVSHDGLWVSETDYWRDYYLESDIHYEWNNGRLEEKPVSDYETYLVYAWFTQLMQHFLRTHPIARMVALEMGFRLPLPSGTVIRKPDFGVVRNDNPQPLLPLDASYHGVFDLCVEALSDKERRGIERDRVTKKAEYAAGGVPEYYILHRQSDMQAFFARGSDGLYAPIEPIDGLIRSQVLPGLQFRLDDLLRQPDLDAMRNDPVYQSFVLPEWHDAEQRAEAEAQRAEAEAQRAKAEAQRAEEAIRARQSAERRAQAVEQELARLREKLSGRHGSS